MTDTHSSEPVGASETVEPAEPEASKLDKAKPLSRSAVKRIGRLTGVTINAMTDGKSRVLEETSEELQRVKRDYANVRSLLEAVVRRHGEQVFDRGDLETVCKHGNVEFSVAETRVTMRLRAKPASD